MMCENGAGVKAELAERLRGHLGLAKSIPVPAQILATVAGWKKQLHFQSMWGGGPLAHLPGSHPGHCESDNSLDGSLDYSSNDSYGSLAGHGYCSDCGCCHDYGHSGYDGGDYSSFSGGVPWFHSSGWGDLCEQLAGSQDCQPARAPREQQIGGCTGCERNTPAKACPHRMCGSCCAGCTRHM